jgi:hypothetical protein
MNSRLRTKSKTPDVSSHVKLPRTRATAERLTLGVLHESKETTTSDRERQSQRADTKRTRGEDPRRRCARAASRGDRGGTTHHGVRTGGALVGREADIVDDEASNREVCRRTNKVSLMAFAAKPSFLEGRVRAGQPSRLSDRRSSGPLRGRAKHSQSRPCRATRSLLTRHGSEQGQTRKDDGGRGWDG